MNEAQSNKHFIINGEWLLDEKIGSGAFGQVYTVKSIVTNLEAVAKLESVKAHHRQLIIEYNLYRTFQGIDGIPKVYWYGFDGVYNTSYALIMDYLGPSLEDLHQFCEKPFSVLTVLSLGIQILQRIRDVHRLGIMHRDIKPDNLVMGRGLNSHKLYMIDFGLAKPYLDMRTNQHIPFKRKDGLVGSPRYASIHTHDGVEQSRRDDLICTGYCLIYLLKGKLPWMGIQERVKEKKYEKIRQRKKKTPLKLLCENLPNQFFKYMVYVSYLNFADVPDYQFLLDIFIDLHNRMRLEEPLVYDWMRFQQEFPH